MCVSVCVWPDGAGQLAGAVTALGRRRLRVSAAADIDRRRAGRRQQTTRGESRTLPAAATAVFVARTRSQRAGRSGNMGDLVSSGQWISESKPELWL